MNLTTDGTQKQKRYAGQVESVEAARRCPNCGRKLYMKLGDCSGMISIKCQKCGQTVTMNLALRKTVR